MRGDDGLSVKDPSMNPIAIFRSRQILALYRPPSTNSAFAQSANRARIFHVKYFGMIARDEHTRFLLGVEQVSRRRAQREKVRPPLGGQGRPVRTSVPRRLVRA